MNRSALSLLLVVAACDDSTMVYYPDASLDAYVPPRDAGTDAGKSDAGHDAGQDAGRDSGTPDSGFDAGVDSSVADAGIDSGMDAGVDAGQTRYVCLMAWGTADPVTKYMGCDQRPVSGFLGAYIDFYGTSHTVANTLATAAAAGAWSDYATVSVVNKTRPGTGITDVTLMGYGSKVTPSSSTQVFQQLCVYNTASAYALDNGLCVAAP